MNFEDLEYWIAGGVAIDLFVGRETRTHEDFDIAIDRKKQLDFQNALAGWDLQYVSMPGQLRPWGFGDFLEAPFYSVWYTLQKDRIELFLTDFTDEEWIYRRDPTIRGPKAEFGWRHPSGAQVIAPEIQLLYKSKNPREKDTADFHACLPTLVRKEWLRERLPAGHAWLEFL